MSTVNDVQPLKIYSLFSHHFKRNFQLDGTLQNASNSIEEFDRFLNDEDTEYEQLTMPQPAENMCGRPYSIMLIVEVASDSTDHHARFNFRRDTQSPHCNQKETLILVAQNQEDYDKWMKAFRNLYNHELQVRQEFFNMLETTSNPLSSSFTNKSTTPRSERTAISEFNFNISLLLDAMLDPTVISNDKGVIIAVNSAAEALFEWNHKELIGRNVKVLMPTVYSSSHDEYMENYKKTQSKHLLGKPRDVLGKTKRGHTFSVEITLGEINPSAFSQQEETSIEKSSLECNVTFMAVFRLPSNSNGNTPTTPLSNEDAQSIAAFGGQTEEHEKHDPQSLIENMTSPRQQSAIRSTNSFIHRKSPRYNNSYTVQTNKSPRDPTMKSPRNYDSIKKGFSFNLNLQSLSKSSLDEMVHDTSTDVTGSARLSDIDYLSDANSVNVEEEEDDFYFEAEMIPNSQQKMNTRLDETVKYLKNSNVTDFEILWQKFMLLQKQVEILESNNESLLSQLELNQEAIEMLEVEYSLLRHSPRVTRFLESLHTNSYGSIVLAADKCGKANQIICCKHIHDFETKYAHTNTFYRHDVISMEKDARKIFEIYFSNVAGRPVNVTKECKSFMASHLDVPTQTMFMVALDEIVDELVVDVSLESVFK